MPGPERVTVREVGHEPHGAKGVIAGWHVDFRSGGPDVRIGSSAAVSIISPLGQVSLTQQTYPKVNALGGPGAGSLAFNPSPPHAVGALFNLAELLCDNQGENAYASLENVRASGR